MDRSIIANISYKFSMYRVSGIMNKNAHDFSEQ